MYIYIYTYVRIHTYIYVRIHTYIHIYIYIQEDSGLEYIIGYVYMGYKPLAN